MTTTRDGNDVLLSNLDLEDIAAALITLGHESIQSTLGYVHGEPGGTAAHII